VETGSVHPDGGVGHEDREGQVNVEQGIVLSINKQGSPTLICPAEMRA